MSSMSMKAGGIFQFGEFQIDARARTLRRKEKIVTLGFRAFDVLLYFVQNPGKVLTRDELLKNVWTDSFVDENSLAQSISMLRRKEKIVTLGFRAFDVLLYFVQNPGKVLTRDELLKNVWTDSFVDENSL